jgi:hypothetical protein
MVTVCTTAETLQHFAIKIIYVLCMSLTINSIHFSRQYQMPGLTKANRLCSLQGSNWSAKCVIQMNISLQRVKNNHQQMPLCTWRVVRRQLLYMNIIYLIDWEYHKQCCHFDDFFFVKCIYCNTNPAIPSVSIHKYLLTQQQVLHDTWRGMSWQASPVSLTPSFHTSEGTITVIFHKSPIKFIFLIFTNLIFGKKYRLLSCLLCSFLHHPVAPPC